MKIASFDIFDTTLLRKCGKPENIFYLTGLRLFPNNQALQDSFYMWRLNAEESEMKIKGSNNLCIKDIYNSFPFKTGSEVGTENAIIIEKDIESHNLVYNYQIKHIILDYRSKGYKICFISDMYLNSTFLKEILIREGCAENDDDIFVSCECGYRKDSGALFDYVKTTYNDIEEWIHYGDNHISDYKICKKKGILPVLVETSFDQCELKIMQQYSSYPFGQTMSILVGFQRCARLHLSNNNADYNNAADYIASAYIPYIIYVFQQAKKEGIKRLYFLSRDCYIHYKMAELIAPNYGIELKYLFLSRKSLSLPLLNEVSMDRIQHLIGSSLIKQKVTDLLNLFQLNVMKFDFPFETIENIEQAETFINIIKTKENEILSNHQIKKKYLEEYFEQEGVYDSETKMAMVDVGWLGTTRLMVNELRRNKGLSLIPFFYYGCRKDILDYNHGKYYLYMPYEYASHDRVVITESYYSVSPYATTIGYKREQDRIVPLFSSEAPDTVELSKVHCEVCTNILMWVVENAQIDFCFTMSLWGVAYTCIFDTHPEYIDYTTMRHLKAPDRGYIIEKISIRRLIKYLLVGKIYGDCLTINSLYDTYKVKYLSNISLSRLVPKIKSLLLNET